MPDQGSNTTTMNASGGNPFDAQPSDAGLAEFRADFGLSGERRERTLPSGFREWNGKLIAEPGAYRDVPITRYHGAECCIGPSISSSGLKILSGEKGQRTRGRTPRHYWEQSNLNPKRRKLDTAALRMGRAFHDCLLLPAMWSGPESAYHRLPEGFSRAAKVKMADEIAEADAAIEAGLCLVSPADVERIEAMAAAMRADPLIAALTKTGEAEVTLAYQDKETGVWIRARPDWMTAKRRFAMNMKTDVDASWDGFSKSIGKYGYAQSAALELDAYEAVFGEMPSAYFLPVVEKPGKGWEPGDYIATALWQVPTEDLERGRWMNRIALRTYADCLAADRWPSYTPEPEFCGMPGYLRKLIDDGGQMDAADDQVDSEEGEA